MSFLIGFLTFILIVDCLLLVLLVLVQLPKKDAGAGLAFGGAASDALFGAGTGNVLTKATKYAAGLFFVLALVLSAMQIRYYHRTGTEFREQLERQAPVTAPIAPPAGTPPAGTFPTPGAAPGTDTAPVPDR
jgi:preprotein translocase subunit SecG